MHPLEAALVAARSATDEEGRLVMLLRPRSLSPPDIVASCREALTLLEKKPPGPSQRRNIELVQRVLREAQHK